MRLRVERRGERSSLVQADGHIPYAPRVVPAPGGWVCVVLVQTVAGPLAGDVASIDVEVGAGAAFELATNAATLAYPAASPARHLVRVRLGPGARFAWAPAPLILAAGCNLEASVELELADGAAAFTRELVVLGRHGEAAGRYRSRLRCELDGRPLLHDSVEVDPDGVALSSYAVLAGAHAFASLALLGLEPPEQTEHGELRLAGPGHLRRALAADTATLGADIAPTERTYRRRLLEQRSDDRAGALSRR